MQETNNLETKQIKYFTYNDVMNMYEPTGQNEMVIKDLSTCGAIGLSELLKNNSNIISLDIHFNEGVTNIGKTLSRLYGGLASHGNLRTLNIKANTILTLNSVLSGLSENKTIEYLELPDANLVESDLTNVAKFVRSAPVRSIVLNGAFTENYITRGALPFTSLCSAIKENNTLSKLEFSNNGMDGSNTLRLLEALSDKDYFELNIDHGQMSFEAFEKVAEYNRSGKKIIVTYTD